MRAEALGNLLIEARPGFACGEDPPDGVLQFRMNNVTREGRIDLTKKRRVPPTSRKLNDFLLKEGDVLFNATNSPELVGKTAFVSALAEPAVFSNHFLRLRPNDALADGRYLALWLQKRFSERAFETMCRQWVGQATVNREQLLSERVPVPPLPEQRRIADILDRAETLRAQRRQALAQLDALGEAIFLEMFGEPQANPKRLPVTMLGEIADVASGSTPSRDADGFYGGSIPWVKTGEVNGEQITSTEESLTEAGMKAARCKLFPAGSLVIAMYGQGKTRGRCAVLGVSATTNQACAVLSPSAHYDTDFLHAQLSMSYDHLRALGRGGNQENLNLGLVGAFKVVLPSLVEQRRFGAARKSLRAVKEKHQDALTELNALFTSLQHRAFRGEL